MTSPWYAVGTVTSSTETGSSSTGPALAIASDFASQPLGDDGQVRFTHARQQCLSCLVVTAHAQRGILVLQTVQARHEFVLVALRLRLDGDREHGRRGFDERHRDGRALG